VAGNHLWRWPFANDRVPTTAELRAPAITSRAASARSFSGGVRAHAIDREVRPRGSKVQRRVQPCLVDQIFRSRGVVAPHTPKGSADLRA
jgi:hypothetical protein